MNKVIKLYTKDSAKNPDAVLEQAVGSYDEVLILGWNKDGTFDPRATVDMTNRELLWLIELFKKKLLDGDYEDE